MLTKIIDLNDDLSQIHRDGYTISVIQGFLIVANVPYVNSQREIKSGKIITELSLSGEKTIKPPHHKIFFQGDTGVTLDEFVFPQVAEWAFLFMVIKNGFEVFFVVGGYTISSNTDDFVSAILGRYRGEPGEGVETNNFSTVVIWFIYPPK